MTESILIHFTFIHGVVLYSREHSIRQCFVSGGPTDSMLHDNRKKNIEGMLSHLHID